MTRTASGPALVDAAAALTGASTAEIQYAIRFGDQPSVVTETLLWDFRRQIGEVPPSGTRGSQDYSPELILTPTAEYMDISGSGLSSARWQLETHPIAQGTQAAVETLLGQQAPTADLGALLRALQPLIQTVTPGGTGNVDGTHVRFYTVGISVDTLEDAINADAPERARMGQFYGTTLELLIAIDSKNRIVQISEHNQSAFGPVAGTITFSHFGIAVEVTIPPPDQTYNPLQPSQNFGGSQREYSAPR
ncbi:MAG TPA: hypothetical protein VFZ97_13255 [Acidimicrobiales bacterium]